MESSAHPHIHMFLKAYVRLYSQFVGRQRYWHMGARYYLISYLFSEYISMVFNKRWALDIAAAVFCQRVKLEGL